MQSLLPVSLSFRTADVRSDSDSLAASEQGACGRTESCPEFLYSQWRKVDLSGKRLSPSET